MKCPKCDKRLKNIYERVGASGKFVTIGLYCKDCKTVKLKHRG